jgi:hypothetical protein
MDVIRHDHESEAFHGARVMGPPQGRYHQTAQMNVREPGFSSGGGPGERIGMADEGNPAFAEVLAMRTRLGVGFVNFHSRLSCRSGL